MFFAPYELIVVPETTPTTAIPCPPAVVSLKDTTKCVLSNAATELYDANKLLYLLFAPYELMVVPETTPTLAVPAKELNPSENTTTKCVLSNAATEQSIIPPGLNILSAPYELIVVPEITPIIAVP